MKFRIREAIAVDLIDIVIIIISDHFCFCDCLCYEKNATFRGDDEMSDSTVYSHIFLYIYTCPYKNGYCQFGINRILGMRTQHSTCSSRTCNNSKQKPLSK